MIRLREIELKNFKNTRMGKIDLQDLQSGASILGLYGQNGSGKTSAVEVMACLRTLMCGDPLDEEILDCIAVGSTSFSISVLFEVGPSDDLPSMGIVEADESIYATMLRSGCRIWYSAKIGARQDGMKPVLLDESLSAATEGYSKRTLARIQATIPENEDTALPQRKKMPTFAQASLFEDAAGMPEFTCEPLGKWRSLSAYSADAAAQILVTERLAYDEGTSYVFSIAFARLLVHLIDELESADPSKNAKTTLNAFDEVVLPLGLIIPALSKYARRDIHLSTTHRSGLIAFHRLHIDELPKFKDEAGQRYIVLTTDKPFTIKSTVLSELMQTIEALNVSLGSLVPGLSLVVRKRDAVADDDGEDAIRAELLSSRDGVQIPFRCESEGIQKLVSILSMLIIAYNDENACVVIDELDSGVFELLLGEILAAIAEGGKGQLVFTAHNLRALETLPNEAIMFTTVNPDNRYIRFRGVRPSNNLRDRYLRSLYLGGQKEPVYEPTDTLQIKSSFYDAGHPNDGLDDFETLVESLRGQDGK